MRFVMRIIDGEKEGALSDISSIFQAYMNVATRKKSLNTNFEYRNCVIQTDFDQILISLISSINLIDRIIARFLAI